MTTERNAEVRDLVAALYQQDHSDRIRRLSEQFDGASMLEAIAVLCFVLQCTWREARDGVDLAVVHAFIDLLASKERLPETTS